MLRPSRPFVVSGLMAVILAAGSSAQVSNPRSGVSAQQVAKPVDPDATAVSRVVVAVKPVGTIPYDGMVLPLTSPEGRYIATQEGRAATWDQIWGLKPSIPLPGLRISVYSVPIGANEPSVKPVHTTKPLPAGALIGRAADSQGFLIELPRAAARDGGKSMEGGRWIGRVDWLSGEVRWLAQGDGMLNAQAVLSSPRAAAGQGGGGGGGGPEQKLAFVRKRSGAATFELVLKSLGGASELVQSDQRESYLFPVFSPDGRTVAALAVPADDPENGAVCAVAFSVPDLDGSGALAEIGRLDVSKVGGIGAAYQCVSSLQLPIPMPLGETSSAAANARERYGQGLVVLSHRDGGPLWWDPRTGELAPLAGGAVAATPFLHDGFGLVLSTAKGLTYQPLRAIRTEQEQVSPNQRDQVKVGREVPVLAGRGIPRATWAPNPSGGGASVLLVLGTPKTGDSPRFEILLVSAARPE